MPTPQSIEAELAALKCRATAWTEAWAERNALSSASVAEVYGAVHVGEPVGERLVARLKESRRELENSIARLAATTAGALARLGRDGDASAIERRAHETFLRIGRHDEGFATKLAELEPLVQRYLRLARAFAKTPGA